MAGTGTHRLRTWIVGIVFFTVIAAIVLLITGQFARSRLAGQFPAPGIMVDADDHKLHVNCKGNGQVTVFLVAGLNEFSVQWSLVQPPLVRETRTCSYDRAGLGWSEPAKHAPTLDKSVQDLRAVLTAIDNHHPVVLVGHSYGAILVRLYAKRYPANIKAVVLLDPASEDMPERIVGYGDALAAAAAQFRGLVPLASLGLMALSTGDIPAGLLKGEAIDQYRALLATGNFFDAAGAETASMIENLHAAKKEGLDMPAQFPVVIISRGQPDPIPGLPHASAYSLETTWSQLQSEMVARMKARQLIAHKSGHSIQLSQPELVVDSVRELISG
jgi:pimeloyl-ACP methyl ester carboxylesterase